ncbi:MAG: hypothetical protein MZV64_19690 [Ignavibacteriales bacterium]|nr:hypothetical protein [Ignavibacteriales bacterium]
MKLTWSRPSARSPARRNGRSRKPPRWRWISAASPWMRTWCSTCLARPGRNASISCGRSSRKACWASSSWWTAPAPRPSARRARSSKPSAPMRPRPMLWRPTSRIWKMPGIWKICAMPCAWMQRSRLLPCVATDREHGQRSCLLELLYSILAEMESGG